MIVVYDYATGESLYALGGSGHIEGKFPMVPGTNHIVAGSEKAALVWDVVQGKMLANLMGHDGLVTCCSVTPDGLRILTGSRDADIRMWDIKSKAEICTLKGHSKQVCRLWVPPEGRYAISSSIDRTLRGWDLAKKVEVWKRDGDVGVIGPIEYIAGTTYAITSNYSEPVLLVLNYRTGQKCSCLVGHEGEITGICVSRDGRFVVSASRDCSVRLWDLQTGKAISCFVGDAAMTCCALSLDERTILAGDAIGAVHFLRIYNKGGTLE
ncbi:WD40 repeat domain-containing protein [Planctomycetota bacterium]